MSTCGAFTCVDWLAWAGDFVSNAAWTVAGIVVALWYESQGGARLSIEPMNTDSIGIRHGVARYARVRVRNVPRRWPLLDRKTATACSATLMFTRVGAQAAAFELPGRWTAAPEPVRLEFNAAGDVVPVPEYSMIRSSHFIDIPPDGDERLDVAVRIGDEVDAFGFTTESYLSDLRHPRYRMLPGAYTVKVTVKAGDQFFRKSFRLRNDGSPEAFALE